MKPFHMMTADEIYHWTGPKFCCRASWPAAAGNYHIHSDLEAHSEEILMDLVRGIQENHRSATFSNFREVMHRSLHDLTNKVLDDVEAATWAR